MTDPATPSGQPLRVILHADMDCFFAAVEVLDCPSLRGKALAVGGTRGRGVVSAASYEARQFGVHSAMPMARALQLCPQLICRSGRHQRYSEVSRDIFGIFHDFTPDVEGLSIDEAFLDCTHVQHLWGDGEAIARALKQAVKRKTGLVVSVGVAPNKFVAKIASDLDKPDGLTVAPTEPSALAAWLAPLPIRRMWGVGPATEPRMLEHGFDTFGDLQRASPDRVRDALGEHGLHWRELAFGRDIRAVHREHLAPKSIGHETTFLQDVAGRPELRAVLSTLADKVSQRARAQGICGRRLMVKIRFPDFSTITRNRTLPGYTDSADAIFQHAWGLLEENVPLGQPLRLVGVTLQALVVAAEVPRQRSLFGPLDASAADARGDADPLPRIDTDPQREVDAVMDRIRGKMGPEAIRRGREMRSRHRHIEGDDKPPALPE